MESQTHLKHLKPGEMVKDFFVIRKKEMRVKKSDGSFYLNLELGNATGRIAALIWDQVQEHSSCYHVGDLVKVLGKVNEYRGRNTLTIEKIRKVREEDRVSPADFLPAPQKDPALLRQELERYLESISDPSLAALLHVIFSESEFRRSYESAPAGKLWHHNRTAGLLEHSLGVAAICDFLASRVPQVNRDLLITGALLHDVGKIKAYQTGKGFIDFSDEGRLLGHLTLGITWLREIMRQVPSLSEEYQKQLMHLLVSHHGELEKGSPVVPMTPEAMILYYADELDSNIDAYYRIAEGDREASSNWSHYVRLLDRFLYFPPEYGEEDEISNKE